MNAFQKAVNDLASSSSRQNMHQVIDGAKHGRVHDKDLVRLALVLGGAKQPNTTTKVENRADIASTGGPSSLSTLICPLYLRAFGYRVPKVSVPGRPAGGIDVMAQIPGFKFKLGQSEFEKIIVKSGYAHSLARDDFAPLDAEFFRYRQKIGAQAVGTLAIASLLSKKVASHISEVGLDVRVAPHGNFGSDWKTARKNAKQFCRVAKLLNIRAVCVLTDGTSPYQPFIGRGESLVALHLLLEERAPQSLAAHDNLCFRIAAITSRNNYSRRPKWSLLKKLFAEHLEAQGSNYKSFEKTALTICDAPRFDLKTEQEGYLAVDLGILRSLLVEIQNDSTEGSGFTDSCGVILRVSHGMYVWPGDIVAAFRLPARHWKKYKSRFSRAFKTNARVNINKFYEEVGYA